MKRQDSAILHAWVANHTLKCGTHNGALNYHFFLGTARHGKENIASIKPCLAAKL